MPSRSMESQKLISEKILQRYVYEVLSYGSKASIKELFPKKYINILKKIKVVIPEFPYRYVDRLKRKKNHKTDFKVIFMDNSSINIELKWKLSGFKNHGEDVYNNFYKGTKGFIIALEKDVDIDYVEAENVSIIDPEKFSFWFLRRSKSIIDGTISNYVQSYKSRNKKNWVIFLPTAGKKGGDSRNDYVQKGRKKSKWAFRFSVKKPVMENIFQIMAGDTVIFVWDFIYLNETKGRQIYVGTDWEFHGLDILKIKTGFYCDINDETFENLDWIKEPNIDEKLYMHYFEFVYPPSEGNDSFYTTSVNQKKIMPAFTKSELKFLPGWEEFVDKIRWSCNNEGAPAEISNIALNSLLVQLDH